MSEDKQEGYTTENLVIVALLGVLAGIWFGVKMVQEG